MSERQLDDTLREAAALLGEGLPEQALVRLAAVAPRPDARASLLRAAACAQAGGFDAAEREIGAAVALQPNSVPILQDAATILAALGQHDLALGHLEAARALAPESASIESEASDRLRDIGRMPEAIATLEHAVRIDPASIGLRLKLTDLLSFVGERDRAVNELQTLARLAPDNPDHRSMLARFFHRLGCREEAVSNLREAMRIDPCSAERLASIADALIGLGAFDEAESAALAAEELDPRLPLALAIRARLALFRGEVDAARTHAERAVAADAGAPDGYVMRAACAILSNAPGNALADLDRAIGISPSHYEAFVWRGEAHRLLGNREKAIGDLFLAMGAVDKYCLAAHLQQVMLMLDADAAHPAQYSGVFDSVAGLLPGQSRDIGSKSRLELVAMLERALRSLEGNRTVYPTHLRDAEGGRRLVLYEFRAHPRARCSEVQQFLMGGRVERVMEEYARMLAQEPQSPIVYAHRAEMYMWMGDYDAARQDLERCLALEPATRWGYAGLCAVEMLEGRYEAALAVSERSRENSGPTVSRTTYVYRAESLRKLGRLDEALAELAATVCIDPERLATWINLALVFIGLGNAETSRGLYGVLERREPFLFRDAAEELKLPRRAERSNMDVEHILEHSLRMMRGNRATRFVSYFNASGSMRFARLARARHASKLPPRDVADRWRRLVREDPVALASEILDAEPKLFPRTISLRSLKARNKPPIRRPEAPTPVLPPGLEQRMLAVLGTAFGENVHDGWQFAGFQIHAHHVDVRLVRADHTIALRLEHPNAAPATATRSASFALRSSSMDESGARALEILVRRLIEQDNGGFWSLPDRR